MERGSSPQTNLSSSDAGNDSQTKFILAAINDAQAIIRATDGKITALSFGLAIPLTKLSTIWYVCSKLLILTDGGWKFCAGILIVAFVLSWAVSMLGALRTLLQVDNPAKNIGGERPSGIFYSATLFQPSLMDIFFPRRLDATTSYGAFFESLPSTDLAIRRELAFELMKVVYIRYEIKTSEAHVCDVLHVARVGINDLAGSTFP